MSPLVTLMDEPSVDDVHSLHVSPLSKLYNIDLMLLALFAFHTIVPSVIASKIKYPVFFIFHSPPS